jgi:hypothetical protein
MVRHGDLRQPSEDETPHHTETSGVRHRNLDEAAIPVTVLCVSPEVRKSRRCRRDSTEVTEPDVPRRRAGRRPAPPSPELWWLHARGTIDEVLSSVPDRHRQSIYKVIRLATTAGREEEGAYVEQLGRPTQARL